MDLPKNIIIVEDEIITQRYLQDIFEQYDVNVVGCFEKGIDTLSAIRNLEFDMILMDINIKGAMDGIQLSRNILRNYNVPIVFITAHNDDDTLEEILELAPYGFIGKPFSSKELLVTLQIAYKRYKIDTERLKTKALKEIVLNKYYTYDLTLSVLYYMGQAVKLNKKQHKLLQILAKNINHTTGYSDLISYIWGDINIADSALRTLVYTLRKSFPELPIASHSKIGYALHVEE